MTGCVQELDVHNRDTKKQIGYQKIRSHWLFVKRFGMILCVKVEKCVQSVTKNQQSANLEDTPTSRGSQWGLIVVPMFCPLKYPIQPCTAQIFAVAEDASPGTIF